VLAAFAAGQSINSAFNGAHMGAMLVFPLITPSKKPFQFLKPPAVTIVLSSHLAFPAIAIVFYGACIDDMVMTWSSAILAVCPLLFHPAFPGFPSISPPLYGFGFNFHPYCGNGCDFNQLTIVDCQPVAVPVVFTGHLQLIIAFALGQLLNWKALYGLLINNQGLV